MLLQNLKKARLGFTLIELAIVLSVIGTVTAGLWRISSNSSQQSKDQATAQQQISLINAVKAFLADNTGYSSGAACAPSASCTQWGGQAFLANAGAGAIKPLALPVACPAGALAPITDAIFCSYLPPGIVASTSTPYGHTFKIQVKAGAINAAQNYSFMIASIIPAGGTPIPDADGGRISGLIGGEGGFNFASAVCVSPNTKKVACGTMGTWTIADITTYGFATPASDGYVVSLSTPSTSTAGLNDQWLARSIQPGDDPTLTAGSPYIYNTMSSDLYMGTYSAADELNSADTGSSIAGNPSIHLHNGIIQGFGSLATDGKAQIFLSEDGTINGNHLLNLTTLCSAVVAPSCKTATAPFAINVSQGDVYINGQVTATKLYSASDVRLKTNIKPIKGALENIMKINPVSFAFKSGGSQSMGVIAQDLEKVYPELVTEANGTKFVEYTGLIGPLVGAIQELKHENDSLRIELNRLGAQEKLIEEKSPQKQ